MIASRRGLGALLVIAIVLAIGVAVDALHVPPATTRELMPGFDADRVIALAWTRPGQPEVRLARATPAARWTFAQPAGWAEPRAVADLLAALRGARWHRRADRARAGSVHATLTITSDGDGGGAAPRVLGIGEPLAGSEQVWIVDGDHAVLVEAWVARELEGDRGSPASAGSPPLGDSLALRLRAPLADVLAARAIELHGGALALDVVLAGTPRRMTAPRAAWLDPDRTHALERALAALTLVRLPDRPIGAATGLHVQLIGVDGGELTDAGGCHGAPALVAITGPWGDGCVDAAAWAAVLDAAVALVAPAADTVDRRPAPIAIAHATLAAGEQLDVTGRPQVVIAGIAHAADPPRVAAWLAALAEPAEVVARPAAGATGALTISDRAGTTIAIDLYAGGVLARRGEPIALRPTADAWRALIASGRALRDPVLWHEEPTAITAITIDRASWQRGAVIGEWTRTAPTNAPADAAAAHSLEQLAGSLTSLTGELVDDSPTFVAVHHVTFAVTAPGAPPVERALDVGPPAHDGCLVRVDRAIRLVRPLLCLAVDQLARASRPL